MSEPQIRVEGLGKQYQLGERVAYHSLRESLAGLFHRGKNGAAADTMWALKDVSFEVQSGEAFGIIGHNGAGKSTLLKILSRITPPTTGRVELNGVVGSLLEVGTGFHAELTGRENIYLNGAILGMRKRDITRHFDEIVSFAGVDKFLDTPVKRYSSGMYVRLAFAVAAHLQPDILLVDEVLAVGDADFQRKCLSKMGEVARGGRTVLFVSHSMGAIRRLCSRAIWLDRGSVRMDGSPEAVIAAYLSSGAECEGERVWPEGIANPGVEGFRLNSVSVRDASGQVADRLDICSPFSIELAYTLTDDLPPCRIGFQLTAMDGTVLFEAYDSDDERFASRRTAGRQLSRCHIPGNLLQPGPYVVSVNAGIPNVKNLLWLEGALRIEIEETGAIGAHMMKVPRAGLLRPKLAWECERR